MALPEGKGAREWGRFRETRHGDTAVAVVNDDEATPISVNVTKSGDNEIISSLGASENLVIKGFHFSNRDSSAITVLLKAGEDGVEKFETNLPASGGNFDKNLVGRYWRLPLGKPLIINLSANGDVLVSVEYEGEEEPAEEAVTPSDSLAIAEALMIETSKILADSVTFTDSEIEAPGLNLDDAIDIVDSGLTITGDRTKPLEDTLPIAEQLANQITLSLNDSQSIAESFEYSVVPG